MTSATLGPLLEEGIDIPSTGVELEMIEKLSKDLRAAARTLSPDEARYMVDEYYQLQRHRLRAGNQIRASAGVAGEPHAIMTWMNGLFVSAETNMKRALQAYAEGSEVGQWSMSIRGIGPVLAAGLLAHIDIEKAPTVGHIWRFAGLDPTVKWLGQEGAKKLMGDVHAISPDPDDENIVDDYAMTPAEFDEYTRILDSGTRIELNSRQIMAISRLTNRKFGNLLRIAENAQGRVTATSMTAALAKRPWNARLKVICWRIGESFVKVQNHDDDIYGHIYAERKQLEEARNADGMFADQAAVSLAGKRYRDGTVTRAAYDAGRLPQARIHLRATRYAVKLYLAHWHHVSHQVRFGTPPPLPYVISHLGHAHYQAPPNWPMS